ncbi:helix-turn-helix domain-containing protein [Alloscardovia criceti]|uniref:helix-turn-helix domain-containing protein n=1 Tax=Alloscardovia criceti TaxID=356828 RepID=UPI0003657FC7
MRRTFEAESMLNRIISTNIQVLMARRGINQHDLADYFGIVPSSVNKRMTGRVEWKVSDLEKASEYFDVPVETLIHEHWPEQYN